MRHEQIWPRHGRNIKYNSKHIDTWIPYNNFGVTYPRFPKTLPRPTNFLYKHLSKPSIHLSKSNTTFSQNSPPPFVQIIPKLKPIYYPNIISKPQIFCMRVLNYIFLLNKNKISNLFLATFQHLPKSNPTFIQKEPNISPKIILLSPKFLTLRWKKLNDLRCVLVTWLRSMYKVWCWFWVQLGHWS